MKPLVTLRHVARVALLAVGLGALPRYTGAQATARDTTALHVLFVGNSYTYYNDLPSVVADLSRASREAQRVAPEQVLFGGHTLEMHLARGDALAAIRRGGWNVVVLQEQSTRPIDAPSATLRDVPRLAAETRAVGARLALYLTWAREARPLSQDTLTMTYTSAATATGALIVPVGEAWRRARADPAVGVALREAQLSLFDADGSHPSPAGTYLAAVVFFSTLFRTSPIGLPPTTRRTLDEPRPGPPAGATRLALPVSLARELQRVAWEVVQPRLATNP